MRFFGGSTTYCAAETIVSKLILSSSVKGVTIFFEEGRILRMKARFRDERWAQGGVMAGGAGVGVKGRECYGVVYMAIRTSY